MLAKGFEAGSFRLVAGISTSPNLSTARLRLGDILAGVVLINDTAFVTSLAFVPYAGFGVGLGPGMRDRRYGGR